MRRAVVKIGGSTAEGAELDVWLDACAVSRLPLVLVPGGGPFADLVRATQKRLRFSDGAAHAMAILAMEQFGHVILDRKSCFFPARTLAEIEEALSRQFIPVWLPSSMANGATDVPASWDVTSDTLAAWLAGVLGADALMLVKQSQSFGGHDDVRSLTRKGIVDQAFEVTLPPGVEFWLAGPQDAVRAAAALAAGKLPGLRMRPSLMTTAD